MLFAASLGFREQEFFDVGGEERATRSTSRRRSSSRPAASMTGGRSPAMAAAYGLYTHIQSNKRRSIALLLGLFFLVYVMVFAGALAGEALSYDASLDWLHARRVARSHPRAALGDRRHADLDADRLPISTSR